MILGMSRALHGGNGRGDGRGDGRGNRLPRPSPDSNTIF